jgi:hypothetical protein
MLGRGMPQGVRTATTADDANACKTITNDLAEGSSAYRTNGRSRSEEETSSVTRRGA